MGSALQCAGKAQGRATSTNVIVRLDRTTQYCKVSVMESRNCGVLDMRPRV
jgi:hypothetical protein